MSKMIEISDDLGSRVQRHLGRHGGGDLSEYVNAAVTRQLFWDTVQTVRERSKDEDHAVIEAEIQKALDEVRADRT